MRSNLIAGKNEQKMKSFYKVIGKGMHRVFLTWRMKFASTRVFLAALSSSLAFFHGSSGAQALGEIEAMGSAYKAAKPAADTNARLTIYRRVGDVDPASVSVYVNARYHASLQPGGFTNFCVKLLPIEIGTRAVSAMDGKRGPLNVVKLTPQAGSQQFFNVTDQPINKIDLSERKLVLQNKTGQEAAIDLAQAREQIHTLSRAPAVVPCEDAPAAQAAVVVTPIPNFDTVNSSTTLMTQGADLVFPSQASVASYSITQKPQVVTLKSDDLFHFDRAGLYNISASGRSMLGVVIARIKSEYERIDSIKVIGYTQPLSQPELKQIKVSERAEAVRDFFMTNGLQSIRVVSEVRSDQEFVDASCETVKTKASILCNRSDRRVVVEITGARSKSP